MTKTLYDPQVEARGIQQGMQQGMQRGKELTVAVIKLLMKGLNEKGIATALQVDEKEVKEIIDNFNAE